MPDDQGLDPDLAERLRRAADARIAEQIEASRRLAAAQQTTRATFAERRAAGVERRNTARAARIRLTAAHDRKEPTVPEPTIRPDVVALLADIDTSARPWTHTNGHALTDTELDLAMSATPAELHAAAHRARADAHHTQTQSAALDRIAELVTPYRSQLPKGTPVRAAAALMTTDEREEFDALLQRVQLDGATPPDAA